MLSSERTRLDGVHSDDRCATRALSELKKLNLSIHKSQSLDSSPTPLARISQDRINKANSDPSLTRAQPPPYSSIAEDAQPSQTVLYLAYGSNLAASTFLDSRGIRPLAAMNVVVPSLSLTFDLAGIPYSEPCFANTRRRFPSPPLPPPPPPITSSEKGTLLPTHLSRPPYHKDAWHKGLVGVVYEVTPSDYAHIIATEGGGSAYTDILVPCHILPPTTKTVPVNPSSPSFLAHTLFSPTPPPGAAPDNNKRVSRSDPSYAQPSARYLNLITTGAAEHELPGEYQDFLKGIRSYTITTERQRLGAWIFTGIWAPIIAWLFLLQRAYAGEDGTSPSWLVGLMRVVFRGLWDVYDWLFKGLFGDGERTGKGDCEIRGDGVGGRKEGRLSY